MYTSLILDARTAGARLPRQLSALQRVAEQPTDRVEILVVDDTGDPRLPELARRYGFRLCPCEGTPLGDRLNTAVAHSHGEMLIFPTPDTPLPNHWLHHVTHQAGRHQWDVAVLPSRQQGRLARLWRRLNRHPASDILCCVSRCWFERIGGFDPSLDREALPDLVERLRACQARVNSDLA